MIQISCIYRLTEGDYVIITLGGYSFRVKASVLLSLGVIEAGHPVNILSAVEALRLLKMKDMSENTSFLSLLNKDQTDISFLISIVDSANNLNLNFTYTVLMESMINFASRYIEYSRKTFGVPLSGLSEVCQEIVTTSNRHALKKLYGMVSYRGEVGSYSGVLLVNHGLRGVLILDILCNAYVDNVLRDYVGKNTNKRVLSFVLGGVSAKSKARKEVVNEYARRFLVG